MFIKCSSSFPEMAMMMMMIKEMFSDAWKKFTNQQTKKVSVSALGNLEKKNAQLPDYGCDNDTLTLTLTVYLCVNYQKKKNHSMSGRGGKSRKRRRRRKELLYIKKIRSDRPAGREKCKNRKLRLKIKIYNNKAWRKLFSHFHSTPLNYDSHISHN